MARTPAPERRLLGQTLAGKYRLVAVRAGGAFGMVFKAEQYFCGRLVRPVAVKVSYQTGLTEQTAPALFSDALTLAQVLAGDDHDGKQHLVPIHDMGLLPEQDGRGYLVMEYVDGAPLLAHMRAAGRVSVASGLRYVKEICRALALCHRQGAVHRDLKPDNVLLDRRGVVRVVDFGLATFTDPRLGFAPGSMGTFAYMAPETLHGHSTPASDVYGLGLLLYELFTGGGPHLSAPWSADDREDRRDVHYRIKRELRFAPPSAAHNEIRFDHRWLDGLILRCLEVDPRRRFSDAGRLLEAIETCAAGGFLPEAEEFLPAEEEGPGAVVPPPTAPAHEDLIRDARRLLAAGSHDQAIDRLDVHRPAEWAVLNADSARVLRLLGQAYLGRGDLARARECLEQLRDAQREHAVLPVREYAVVLTELRACYRGLGLAELADACGDEARQLVRREG
ncbi:MAG TPA: protein kinase [Gemmataceae bacterium]|nr:protein kinase [Gemmataceae bacterium]